jgi:O-antigen/teichoic acid export membrane protein
VLAAAPYLVKLKKKEENKRISLLIMMSSVFVLLGIFSSLFLYFTCEWIISILYGGQYVEAVPVVKQMCLYLIPFIPISMFLNNVLVFFGYDKSYLITMVSGMAFNIISSILLIKYFSLLGAVLAIGITALTFIAVSTYYLIKNNKSEVYNEGHLQKN